MKRINEFALYELAGHLKQLTNYSVGTRKADAWLDAMLAHNALEQLLYGDPVTIEFSHESANDLLVHIRSQYLTDHEGKDLGPFDVHEKDILEHWSIDRYKDLLGRFEAVFAEEMRAAATYFIPRFGIYHTPSLVDNADNVFPASVKAFIPYKSEEDWKAAGKCLAFGLYSASGFHITRSIEGVLEHYYQQFCNKPTKKTLNNWHSYLEALGKVATSPKPSEKTLAGIEHMKNHSRNPLVHPRIVLSETDAALLFDSGKALIISMASEIAEAGLETVASTCG